MAGRIGSRVVSADVYLDTDVLVNCVYPDLPLSEECQHSVEQIRRSQSRVYFSSIAPIEYAQAFRTLATRGMVPHGLSTAFNLADWAKPAVRYRWMHYWRDELERFIATLPYCLELTLNAQIHSDSFDLMARYALRSLDACHLATALHYEIPVFWTCDDHFERVDDLYVEVIRESR